PAAATAVAALPAAGRLAGAAAGAGASAFALVGVRLLTFSTTTALVRPWLKLWRTTPCSPPRPFRLRVLLGATLSFFSPVFSVVSAIPVPIPRACARFTLQRCASAGVPWRRLLTGNPSGNAQDARGAPETSRFQDRRVGLHVPHLTAPMPNPIAPR